MRMPTTTNVKVKKEHKAPKSVDIDDDMSEMEFTDAGTQCVTFLEKKMRNLEKRKKKMEVNKEKAVKGEKLTKEAEKSLEQYDLVAQDLQFAKELHKQFVCINEKYEDSVKKMAKKEIKRIEEVLRLQHTLDQLGGDLVRQDFITGKHGAVVLTQDNLNQLDALYQEISPSRESNEKDDLYAKKLYTAADHLVNYLNGEESQVVGTTYKELKELVTLIDGCGYFERIQTVERHEKRDQETAAVSDIVEDIPEVEQAVEESDIQISQTPEETVELPVIAQPVEETQPQPLNTLEQDAFFAPSSSPYQPSVVSDNTPFSSQSASNSVDNQSKSSLPDIQSFTHNRPFQFIQTSYVMPDADSPSVVDPAVIAAQPAGAHGLQFISPIYDTSVVSSSMVQSTQPPQQQQQHQPPQLASHQPSVPGNSGLTTKPPQSASSAGVNVLNMPVDLSQAPVDLSQPGVKQQQSLPSAVPSQEFNVQSGFQQSESLFPNQPVGHEDISTSLASDTESRTSSLREDTISTMNYDIPPSIPMPPSQSQDQTQAEPQEKKSPMNANAPVFHSMYSQGVPKQVQMPPPSVSVGGSDIQVSSGPSEFASSFGGPSGDFVGAGDFQTGYQASNGFLNGNYGRGPSGSRGGYRGSRGGGGPGPNNTMNNRNGGSPVHNGFGPRGTPANTSSSRGGRGGNSYQNYNAANQGYRSDGFQAGGYGSSNTFNNSYPKRGGMNNTMGGGPGNTGYPPRPAIGGNAGRGGMRGMPRGGPRGAPRAFSRPQ